MGFRDPITTADALDTTGGDWGVKGGIRTNLSVPSQPTLELQTGYLDSPVSLSAGGGGSAGGGAALYGGKNLGVAAPTLKLQTEPQPDGSQKPTARLSGASFLDLGGAYVSGAKGGPTIAFTFAANWHNFGGAFAPLTLRPCADGRVHVLGVIACSVGPYSNGWQLINGIPSASVPSVRSPGLAWFGGGSAGYCGLLVNTDGTISIDTIYGTAPAAGTGLEVNFTYWPANT